MRALLVILFVALIVMLMVFLFTMKHDPNLDRDDEPDEENTWIDLKNPQKMYVFENNAALIANRNSIKFGSLYRRTLIAKQKTPAMMPGVFL